MKKYRFFYHYFKQRKCMSIHFKGACEQVDDIQCEVPCETKWNKTMPQLVMRGWASKITIRNNKAYIT